MSNFFRRLFGSNSGESQNFITINSEVNLFLNDLVKEAIEIKEGYSAKLSNLEHYKTLKNKPDS